MAGGGIKGVRALGVTDEFGVQASEKRVDAHDLNSTILRLMGMNRLTDVNGDGEFSAKLLG